ncbi:hypothetical protein P3L10_033048 [Capsicum annuum]
MTVTSVHRSTPLPHAANTQGQPATKIDGVSRSSPTVTTMNSQRCLNRSTPLPHAGVHARAINRQDRRRFLFLFHCRHHWHHHEQSTTPPPLLVYLFFSKNLHSIL